MFDIYIVVCLQYPNRNSNKSLFPPKIKTFRWLKKMNIQQTKTLFSFISQAIKCGCLFHQLSLYWVCDLWLDRRNMPLQNPSSKFKRQKSKIHFHVTYIFKQRDLCYGIYIKVWVIWFRLIISRLCTTINGTKRNLSLHVSVLLQILTNLFRWWKHSLASDNIQCGWA